RRPSCSAVGGTHGPELVGRLMVFNPRARSSPGSRPCNSRSGSLVRSGEGLGSASDMGVENRNGLAAVFYQVIRNPPVQVAKVRRLFPRLRRDGQFHTLALALDTHLHGLPDLHRVEGIRVVVDVRDLLGAEFDNDVATLQAGFLGRT